MFHRVVVTGMGVVSPAGNSVETMFNEVVSGHSAVGPTTRYNVENNLTKISAEVKDLDFTSRVEPKKLKKLDLFSQYASFAAAVALDDAKIKSGENVDPSRIGSIIGTGVGGLPTLETSYKKYLDSGVRRIPIFTIPTMIANTATAAVAMQNDLQGPVYDVTTACSSGSDSIINAAGWIQLGRCDVMVAGGAEESITEFCIGAFNMLKALSTNNDHPELASRPFDKDRDGFVMGDGAGILVLESLEHALARKAKIYAELVGYGMSCDAHHITAPSPDGRGAVQAMKRALEMAKMPPENIDYINAHGTSTDLNDKIETQAIKDVFGEHARKLKVSSSKGVLGHTIGAAGALEAIISINSLRHDIFPMTAGLRNPDVEQGCDLDYVIGKSVNGPVRAVMSNSLGFGGHNAVLLFADYK